MLDPLLSNPPSSSASGLLNLSKYKLNSGCKSLLAKGGPIKYIPAPRETKRIEVEEAYSNFARRLKISFFFHNKISRTRDQKFRPKSNFNPPATHFNSGSCRATHLRVLYLEVLKNTGDINLNKIGRLEAERKWQLALKTYSPFSLNTVPSPKDIVASPPLLLGAYL